MNAANIAHALNAKQAGTGWKACCPAHKDSTPSLAISAASDGRTLLYCHAGCDQSDVIAILRQRGLWEGGGKSQPSIRKGPKVDKPKADTKTDTLKRRAAAGKIWHATSSAKGTLVATYLASRGLVLPASGCDLRFHYGLKHPSGDCWPAMVAKVTHGKTGEAIGIHRTFLARDGSSKAPLEPDKMMFGPCRGGAVRLAALGTVLMIGEGIETCLSAMQATGHPAWAAMSTSGLRTLDLPDDVRDVIVLADGDVPGEAAALDCARRWKREGRRVRIARPPAGSDFNDLLKKGA